MKLGMATASLFVLILASPSFAQRKEAATQKSGLAQFSWIVGTWEVTGNMKKAVEKWTRDSSGAYAGIGMTIKDKDTTITQRSKIAKDGGKIVFSTEFVLRKQSSRFVFDRIDSSEYHFENPDSSQYPRTVSYQPIGADSLASWVGGPSGGGAFQRQGFKYRRSR